MYILNKYVYFMRVMYKFFLYYFGDLDDKRESGKIKYDLFEVLFISFISTLYGEDSEKAHGRETKRVFYSYNIPKKLSESINFPKINT